jgi:hypothetical protein
MCSLGVGDRAAKPLQRKLTSHRDMKAGLDAFGAVLELKKRRV